MIFLAPASAVLAAAIAVPVLVTLYLLKLRRRPMRVSTTVFWEQAEKDLQANVPLRWLKPSWLLLMHLVVLALLILALGRPAAELPSSLGGARRVILLIDRSASMSARDGAKGATRLDEAKERALRAIDELSDLGGSRSATVVSFAGDAAALTRWSSSRGLLRDAVMSIEPTDQAGDLAGAIKLAEAIAAGSADEEAASDPPLVLVFSDGSFKLEGPIQAAGLQVKLEPVPAEKAGDVAAGVGGASAPAPNSDAFHDNLGIVAIAARRDYADPTRVRVLVKVQNASAEQKAVPLTVSLDGKVIERRAVEVPGARTSEGGGVDAGSVTTTFEFLSGEGGLVMVQIAREDLLASDNAAALVLGRPERPGILLYRPSSGAGGPVMAGEERRLAPSDWLLEDALRELRPRMLSVREVAPEFVLDQADLNGHDLVIFDRVTPSARPPIASLSFGAVPPGLGVRCALPISDRSNAAERVPTADAGPVLLWDRTHPLLRDVALDSLYVGKDIGLSVEATGPEGVKVTELARGRDGALIVLAEAGGVRHIVTGFELAQSNWPSQVSFPIFLASAVEYLTMRGESSLGRSFTTSQAVTLAVKPAAGGGESTVTLAGPMEVKGTAREGGEVSFGVLARAGVYVVESPRALEKAVAVNLLDATESAVQVKRELTIGATASHAGEGKARREIWPWLVIVAAGLLFVEWVVYAVRMRA